MSGFFRGSSPILVGSVKFQGSLFVIILCEHIPVVLLFCPRLRVCDSVLLSHLVNPRPLRAHDCDTQQFRLLWLKPARTL